MPRSPFRALLNLAAAALFSLCGGAMWSVILQLAPRFGGWFVLAVALVSVLALTLTDLRSRGARATTAAGFFLLSVVYAHYLHAAGVVAASAGLSFVTTLRQIGPEMAFAVERSRGGVLDVLLILCSLLLSIWLALRSAPSANRLPRDASTPAQTPS